MKTLQTLVMVLLLGSALQSQTAWTSWNVYRDSTASGADPVGGGFLCPSDTVWLIVDTTGMGAAGITGWRWRYDPIVLSLTLVHCGSPECLSYPLPRPFPYDGLPNELKVGVRVGPFTATYNFLLVTYYANGDSLITAKTTQVKGGNASLSLPFWACAGSSVPVHVDVNGILDSFVVSYTIGSTPYEIRNQTDFTITLPSGDGTLPLTLTQYVCGNSFTRNYGIPYYSSPPSPGPVPSVWAGPSACPNVPREFRVFSLPPGYTSFVWKVNGNSVDPSSTNHPLAYTWLPPEPGTYTISYEATYPCGTVSGSRPLTVNPAPTPTLSVNVFPVPGSSGYCPGYSGLQITASASVSGGLYSIDVGNDGIIEAYYPSYFLPSPGVIPASGLPIKVSFDDGCGNVVSTIYNYVPSSMADPGAYTASASISPPSPARCPGDSIDVSLSVPYFPEDSIRNIQWSWDGSTWTPPSNSFTARLATPLTPGPWTLYCRFDAFSPDPCVVAPTSPVSRSIISAGLGSPPPLRQIGSVCLSGGTVGLVPDITTSHSGIDSIRYVLPDGTIIKRHVSDTLLLNIPSGVFSYPVVYQGQVSCGYTAERIYTITSEQTPPQVYAYVSASSVCSGANVHIIGSYSSGSSVDSIVAILWNGDRVRMPISGSSSANISVAAPSAPGIYSVQVIAFSCAGSDTASVTFQVTSGATAVANFTGPSIACVGDTVIFQRSGTNRGVTEVSWSFGDGFSSRDTAMQVAHIYTRAGTYRVSLELRSVECGLSEDEHLIRVYDAPPTLSDLIVAPSDLSISYSVSASDYDQIVWDFGDGQTATGVLSGTHTYANSGTYTVTVTAINACGTNESSVTVTVSGLALGRSGGWLVYPNPTRQEVFIAHPSYQGEVRVEVYDLVGRLVQAEEISAYPGRMRLNLPNGLYTLRLISREGVATTKLLVE